MKTLISMTDFVLEQKKRCVEYHKYYGRSWGYRPSDFEACLKYAEFLKKPLELEMFVPCDQNGNILSEPEMIEKRLGFDEVELDYNYAEVEVYKKAKEKVLFDGFHIEKDKLYYAYFYFCTIDDLDNKNVEDLLYELPEEDMPILTESAIKLIGL